jgi:sodium-coupled neutral amino acid transporter 9
MVGTSTLVFPVLFCKSGIVLGIGVATLIAFISGRTTQLLMVHNKTEEVFSITI